MDASTLPLPQGPRAAEYPDPLREQVSTLRGYLRQRSDILEAIRRQLWEMQTAEHWRHAGYPTFPAFCEAEFGWHPGYLASLMHDRRKRSQGGPTDRRRFNGNPNRFGPAQVEISPNWAQSSQISQPPLLGDTTDVYTLCTALQGLLDRLLGSLTHDRAEWLTPERIRHLVAFAGAADAFRSALLAVLA
jgi:hypothetical protein